MGGPLGFLYTDQPGANPTPQKEGGLDFLYSKKPDPITPQTPSGQQGFFSYVSNIAKNWVNTATVSSLIDPQTGQVKPEAAGYLQQHPEWGTIVDAVRKSDQTGGGVSMTMNDFMNFGSEMFKNVKGQLAQVLSSPSQTFDQIKGDFPGFMGGIAKAFVTPIGDMMELTTGVKLSDDDVSAMTPEEKRDRIKNVVATGAMLATGAGIAKGLGAGSAALRSAVAAEEAAVGSGALSTDALMDASRLSAKGAFAKEVLKNTATAAASGASYGMVRYANEKDQLSQTLINGIVFAPIGVAFELGGLGKGTREARSLAAKAGDVAVLRQARNVIGNSVGGVVDNVLAMGTADDLAEAVMNGRLATTRNDVIHIPGVSSEQLSKLATNLPEGFKSTYRFDPGGESGSILVYNSKVSDLVDTKFYAENGYLRDQIVSHNGTEYKVAQGNGKELLLESVNDAGNKITAPVDQIRPISDTKLAMPSVQQFINEEHTTGENTRYWQKAADEAGKGEPGVTRAQSEAPNGQPVYHFIYRDAEGNPQGVLKIQEPASGNATMDVRVSPEMQRKGIGTQLYNTARDAGFDIERLSENQLQREPGKMFQQGRLMKAARMTVLDQTAAVDRLYSEWKGQAQDPIPTALDLAKEERAQLGQQLINAKPEEMAALMDQNAKLEEKIKKLQIDSHDPSGFDDPTTNNLVGQSPTRGIDYQADMRDFFNSKSIPPEEHAAWARQFENRFAKEALDTLEPDEKRIVNAGQEAAKGMQAADIAARGKAKMLDAEKLVRMADSNGYRVSDHDGAVVIRDAESGKPMFRATSLQDAAKWIDGSGQAEGVDLDPGGPVKSASATGGRAMTNSNTPVNDNPAYKFFGSIKQTAKNLSSENAIRFLDNFALITQNREYFTGLDTKYNTKMFSDVFDKTQSARRIANAKIRPYYEKLQGIEKIVKGMSPAEREQIGRYMQTMTPDEVKASFKSKPMNPVEIKLAEGIAKVGVDLEPVFNYRRQVKKIMKEFAGDASPEADANRAQAIQAAKDNFGIDEKHQQVVDAFDVIEDTQKSTADLGSIVRLARSIQDGELSRAGFASKHKMSFEQIRAANQLDQLYGQLATSFNIPKANRLGGYMTHARLYADGNVGESLRMFGGDTQAREFYAKMTRTGEISAYEMDPIRSMQRYIKAGMDAIHFSEAYADAKNSAVEEIKKLPAGMQQHVQNVTERYLSDLRGFPGAAEAATQASVDHLLDKFKIDADVSVRKQIVNGITAIVPAATQGIRIAAGIRDFGTHMLMYSSRFGYKRMARAIITGAKAMTGPIREELERLGDITVASPIAFADATEASTTAMQGARSAFAKGLDATTRVMFKLSGQQDVYAMMHAGAYLETREVAAGALLDMTRGKSKWADVVKKTSLETYDQPVVDKFKELAQAGKTDEAARFLAVQTGYEQIGVFGLANQPYLWGTNAGKIVGQFGRWPTWLRSNITRMASRGTPGQRILAMTRLAAGSALVGAAGQEMGLDLSSWNPIKGLFFAGGPLVDVYETISDAVGGSGYVQADGQRRLAKMLPWNRMKQIYIPGSYFADDMVKAIQQFQQGNVGTAAAQAGGFHPISAGPTL